MGKNELNITQNPQPTAAATVRRTPVNNSVPRTCHQSRTACGPWGSLPGLVALGVLKPAQANAIRGTYREILQYHQGSRARAGREGLPTPDVLELARKDPHLLSMLEPILTGCILPGSSN